MSRSEILEGMRRVHWSAFRTAYSDASAIPDALDALLFSGLTTALDAAADLWAALCHQHVYTSSAALPAYRYIHLALREAPEQLVVEVLDIVLGFASVPIREFGIAEAQWSALLSAELRADHGTFQSLEQDANDEISTFASEILASL